MTATPTTTAPAPQLGTCRSAHVDARLPVEHARTSDCRNWRPLSTAPEAGEETGEILCACRAMRVMDLTKSYDRGGDIHAYSKCALRTVREVERAPAPSSSPRDERLKVIARPDPEKCQHGLRRSDCEWCVFSGTAPAPSPAPSGPNCGCDSFCACNDYPRGPAPSGMTDLDEPIPDSVLTNLLTRVRYAEEDGQDNVAVSLDGVRRLVAEVRAARSKGGK